MVVILTPMSFPLVGPMARRESFLSVYLVHTKGDRKILDKPE